MNHRWLKLRTGLLWLAGILCLFSVIELGIFVLHRPSPCRSSCPNLGTELDSAASQVQDKVYTPRCNPLELTLELDKTEVKVNQRYPLWYRVGVRNVCCQTVTARLSSFLERLSLEEPITLRVWGPDGKEIIPGPHFPGPGDIAAYSIDLTANPKGRAKIVGHGFYTLEPGELIPTSPAIFDPHKIESLGDSPEDWMKRTTDPKYNTLYRKWISERDAEIRRVITETRPVRPPSGYRPLMDFIFNKPGRYRIQAVFADEISVDPSPTWLDVWPEPLRGITGLALEMFDRYPSSGATVHYRVHAESPIQEFEVQP